MVHQSSRGMSCGSWCQRECWPLVPLVVERTEDDWVSLEVKDGMFLGYGGPGNLLELIRAFIDVSTAWNSTP